MKTYNLLDKTFGPAGTSAGIVLFIVGLFSIYTSLWGLILIAVGAFFGFTSTGTLIDLKKNRVKFSNNIFGVIRTGQWINIKKDMKIGIRKSHKVWRAYSLSNRPLDIDSNDFRIILYNSFDQQIMPLKKTNTIDSAKAELGKLATQLGLKSK